MFYNLNYYTRLYEGEFDLHEMAEPHMNFLRTVGRVAVCGAGSALIALRAHCIRH